MRSYPSNANKKLCGVFLRAQNILIREKIIFGDCTERFREKTTSKLKLFLILPFAHDLTHEKRKQMNFWLQWLRELLKIAWEWSKFVSFLRKKKNVWLTTAVDHLGFLPASRMRCFTECCLPCQNCHALISSSGLFSSRNISMTTLCKMKKK